MLPAQSEGGQERVSACLPRRSGCRKGRTGSKDHGRRDGALAEPSNVRRDHNEAKGEADGLHVDKPEEGRWVSARFWMERAPALRNEELCDPPERDEAAPVVLSREEGEEGGRDDADHVANGDHEHSRVRHVVRDETCSVSRREMER